MGSTMITRIDADTHVDETEATWEFMTEAERQYRPLSLDPPDGKSMLRGDARPHRLWLTDGRVGLRRWRDDERTGTTQAQRELTDVPSRLRHMDQMRVQVQVIYPTYLLAAPSDNPAVELAIYRSYNRWLAEATAHSSGRLRWVIMPPLRSPDKIAEELRFGKEHGACGVFKRAIECTGKNVADPSFFPLYEEAERLDLPICIHTGGEDFSRGLPQFSRPELNGNPQIACFRALALGGVTERFPRLRFGVIEAMASWVPYVIADLKAKSQYSGRLKTYADRPMNVQEDFLRANRLYVTCQTSDDVPYLMKFGAEDSLMVGTDYSHDDQSGVIAALDYIERLGDDGQIPPDAARKILEDNPRTFYGL